MKNTNKVDVRPPAERDTLEAYIKSFRHIKLLKHEEEVALAARIKKGDQEARETFIKANLRLVIKIARDYENLGLPLLDLINEGNIGLMKAVERFDPVKGAKFSTYGSFWIKQSLKRALANQGKTIRLPVHQVDGLRKLRKLADLLHDEFDREPTHEELALASGKSVRKISHLLTIASTPASLDAQVDGGESDASFLSEFIADEGMQTASDILETQSIYALLHEVLDQLDSRERTIITLRFGLDGNDQKTLGEVGTHFNVTRERIRQIQNIALRKLSIAIKRKDKRLVA